MASTFEDTVLDFDLNFLHQTANNTAVSSKVEKQRKAILIVKKKTIVTDSLIRKYYAKKELLEQAEKTLLASKEECKNICIDYKSALEKCSKLEQDTQKFEKTKQELQNKIMTLENRFDAIQSHSKQLQLLVNENVTRIESMKIENQLDKANVRDCEKKVSSLNKEKDILLDHIYIIKDVLLGKKKLSKKVKLLLENYKKSSQDEVSEYFSEEENSQDETDVLDDPILPCTDTGELMEENHKRDTQKLKKRNYELQEKITILENRFDAIKSHSKQLQLLVNENETRIESMKQENQLDKANVRNCEKKVSSLNKEKNILLDHIFIIKDVLLGKKKLNKKVKLLLENYKKSSQDEVSEYFSEEDNSPDETDVLDDPMSPCTDTEELMEENDRRDKNFTSKVPTKQDLNWIIAQKGSATTRLKKDEIDRDSDCSNEVVSVDTGRGSSLEFSDSDKCFHSPDYFLNDSPLSAEILSKDMKKLIETATSPITVSRTTHAATSPVIFEPIDLPIIIVSEDCDSTPVFDKTNVPKMTIDKGVSPVKSALEIDNSTNGYSRNRKPSKEIATSPIKFSNKTYSNKECYGCGKTVLEKECLEQNNSDNLVNDNSNDGEIEMILNTMRLTHELITPMPSTPSKSHAAEKSCVSRISVTHEPSHTDSSQFVCLDAAKIREENKMLHSNFADLTKEVISIKSLLMNYLFNNKNSNNKNVDVNQLYIKDQVMKTSHESYNNGCLASNEINVMNDNEDNCSTGDESDIVRLEEPMLMHSHEDLSIDNGNESENDDILYIDTENSTLNTAQKLQFEEETELEYISIIENMDENLKKPIKNNIENLSKQQKRLVNARKLTRLEKLRKRLVPKNKIKSVNTPPLKKLRFKPKQITRSLKKVVKESDSAASLNNKETYDKAVRIMAAIKSKQQKTDKINNITDQNSKKMNVPDIDKSINVRFPNRKKNILPNKDKSNNITDANPSKKNVVSDTANLSDITECRETVESTDQRCAENSITCRRQSTTSSNSSPKSSVTTRSRSKHIVHDKKQSVALPLHSDVIKISKPGDNNNNLKENVVTVRSDENTSTPAKKKRLKRSSVEQPEVEHKRILRSSSSNTKTDTPIKETTAATAKDVEISDHNTSLAKHPSTTNHNIMEKIDNHSIVDYSDLNMFTEDATPVIEALVTEKQTCHEKVSGIQNAHESILCRMIDKHGITGNKVKNSSKMSEATVNTVCKKIEDGIAHILELPPSETKQGMNKFVDELQNLNLKHFLAGLMKYLKNPERKNELFNKVNTPPAPPMTKSEQVLLYVVTHLRGSWPDVDIVNCILSSIEYTLFKLNRTPEFVAIESMSHFYAVLCRYIKSKSRLRLFILDAMYCIQFKSVPLIKQCLDVWMHILPLAHMGIAKSPLVTCLVYLLHFYKCEDKYNRVQEIKNILNRKYSYQITEWNQTKILDMFKNAIKELKDISIEKKMLRIALIILAKRQGPRWCENNIIKNMLQPMIEKEDVPDRVKLFCVSMLGPLLKPYPVDMKVHCEIVMNQLVDMLDKSPSLQMEEAILKTLIFMSKHNQNRVVQVLLSRNTKQISPEMEEILRNYVREKPLRVWKTILSRISLVR